MALHDAIDVFTHLSNKLSYFHINHVPLWHNKTNPYLSTLGVLSVYNLLGDLVRCTQALYPTTWKSTGRLVFSQFRLEYNSKYFSPRINKRESNTRSDNRLTSSTRSRIFTHTEYCLCTHGTHFTAHRGHPEDKKICY